MGDLKQARGDLANVQRSWQASVSQSSAPNHDISSVDDELGAVNEEVPDQSHELRRANEELATLFQSTGLPVLLVDRDLRIRRMTQAAEYTFNLRQGDLDRSLSDLPPHFDGADLTRLARQVIRSGTAAEADLCDADGRRRRLCVWPYRVGHPVEGAALLLIDTTDSGESPVESMIESMVEAIPGSVIVLNHQLRVVTVSRDFLSSYGLVLSNVRDRPLDEVLADPFGAPAFKVAMERLVGGQSEAEEFELLHTVPGARERAVLVTARRFEQAESYQVVVTLRDITTQSRAHQLWAHALIGTEDALQLSHQELRALAGRLMHTQDEERRRLSHELHDDLSQNVVALQLDLEALTKELPPDLLEGREHLRTIRNSAQQLADDLRRIAHGLHPSTIEVLGLRSALDANVREFSQRTGIPVAFSAAGVPERLPPEIAASFYRIVQEALRNIAKHAAGGAVSITLLGDGSRLTLSVRDSGPGFDREKVRGLGGLGLVSMEERARLIRATFQLDTSLGEGVAITVSAPLV